MAKSKLVGLIFEAWNDMDQVLDDLEPSVAIQRLDGGSSFAWTLAHVTSMVDAWINVRFQGQTPHVLISEHRFGMGSNGAAEDWQEVLRAVSEVRGMARQYLEQFSLALSKGSS